jgi:hypothetical protein
VLKKLFFLKTNSGDRNGLGRLRKPFVEHPDAILFLLFRGKRLLKPRTQPVHFRVSNCNLSLLANSAASSKWIFGLSGRFVGALAQAYGMLERAHDARNDLLSRLRNLTSQARLRPPRPL